MLNIETRLLCPEGKRATDFLRTDGIWDFVAQTDARDAAVEPETMAYQDKYAAVSNAASYNEGYRIRKQHRTRRELAVLRGLMASVNDPECILDMPCGGGRLSSAFAESAKALIEMDLALGQLIYGREHSAVPVPRAWVRASGFQIPLRDKSVDGAACIRLSHHLYSTDEKDALLSELLRVSRRFVILSFADSRALRFAMRRCRDRLAGRPHRTSSIAPSSLSRLARKHGGTLVCWPAIGPFQAHRYALIRKQAVRD